MIELDLENYRDALRGFLTIGSKWLYVPGYVYTTTKEKQVFARMAMQGLEPQEKVDPLMDMSELEPFLKESKVQRIQISVGSGHIMVNEPFVMQVPIAREANPEEAKRLHSFDQMCREIEQEAMNQKAGMFVAPREDFLALLNAVGSPEEPIKISTGESITVTSYKGTGESVHRRAIYDKVSADIKAEVKLSKRAQGHLRKTLEGTSEKAVRVVISSTRPFCIFQNNQLTVLAGGMVKK